MLAVGVAMIVFASLRYDWYTVSKDEAWQLSARLQDLPHAERWTQWYMERPKLETPRKRMVDCGSGLVALAVMLGAFFVTTRFPSAKAVTPQRRLFLVLFYLGAFAVQTPLSLFVLGMRQHRFDYPTWGDSIIIGVFNTLICSVVLGGIGLIILLVVLAFAKFPAPLWVWSSERKIFSTVISVMFGIPVILALLLLAVSVPYGHLGEIVLTTMFIYLFLSLRAGIIAKKCNR